MIIDTREVNQLGPGKFRTSTDNGQEQTCYFNRNKSDSHFNSYTAKRAFPDKLVFSIVKVNSDFNLINTRLEIEVKTNSFVNDRAKRQHQQVDRGDFSDGKKSRIETGADRGGNNRLDNPMYQSQPTPEENQEEVEIMEEKCAKKNQNLSPPPKKSVLNKHRIKYTATRIKYSPTRVKSRNFLSNISYTGISKGDFYNESFILDIFILLVKNLNPFSLEWKVSHKLKHEMIYMLWRECIPVEFYRYICKDNNFKYLNGQDVSQQGILEIVGKFMDQSKDNLRSLQKSLAHYKDIYQYVYSHVFPEIYSTSEKRGINLRSNFHIIFKAYRDKLAMRQQQLAKQPINYAVNEKQDQCEFEQKPIKNFDKFCNGEEQEFKEWAEKRKLEKREQKEIAAAKKLKLKQEENKMKESEMWEKLGELNNKCHQL